MPHSVLLLPSSQQQPLISVLCFRRFCFFRDYRGGNRNAPFFRLLGLLSLKKEVPAGGRKERYGSRRDNRGRNRNAENRGPKSEAVAEKKEAAAQNEA